MSKVTHAIVQWNGSEYFIDLVNIELNKTIRDSNQRFGLVTDFDTKRIGQYGLAGAGGSKAYCMVVAAAAFNHVTKDTIVEAVDTASKLRMPLQLSVLIVEEETPPYFKRWDDGLYM